MAKPSREIECLARLDFLTPSYDAMLDFLLAEALISKEERKECIAAQDKSKWLWTRLAVLSQQNKLSLLSYEWQVLPVERIKIIVITDRDSREFSFNF